VKLSQVIDSQKEKGKRGEAMCNVVVWGNWGLFAISKTSKKGYI
jgi:hypothetical protein